MSDVYQRPSFFVRKYAIHAATLSQWAKKNKIRYIENPHNGRKRYLQADVLRELGVKGPGPVKKINLLYARVSSAKQKKDLERQVRDLKHFYETQNPTHQEKKDYRVLQGVASGVNCKRPGLHTLLDLVHQGHVSSVAVMHKDRLARLGGDFLDWLFKKTDTKLVVYGEEAGKEEHEQDLAADLFAINTVLVASYNGRRAAQNKKRRKAERQARETTQDQDLPAPSSARKKRRKSGGDQESPATVGTDSQVVD